MTPTPTASPTLRRRYVDTPSGQLHLAECGSGPTVLFLHQTPRSWREYELVLPVVGEQVHAVAMDTVGFGDSDPLVAPASIEAYAAAAAQLIEGLGTAPVHVVGHHTGGVIGVELAASRPELVRSLVLSNTPFVDAGRREAVARRRPIDEVEPRADGGHLQALWQARRGFYRPGEERFLQNFVRDALVVLDTVEEGHRAVNRYRMEDRVGLVRAPVLALCGADDPYALPEQPSLAAALGVTTVIVPGGGVALPEQLPAEFGRIVLNFVSAS